MCTREPKDASGGRGKHWTEAATNQGNPEATRIQRRKAVDSSLDAGVCVVWLGMRLDGIHYLWTFNWERTDFS